LSKKIESAVESVVSPIISSMGFELMDVEYTYKRGAESELVIYIDKAGGVDLEDCERVSRAIDEPLDKADPIAESYILCVSSPGLDRPLKKDKDLTASIGKMVDVKLYQKVEGKKEYFGILHQFDEETVSIAAKDRTIRTFARNDIAQIRLRVEF